MTATIEDLLNRYDSETRAHAERVSWNPILRDEDDRDAALLHDVVEDGLATLDEVLAATGEDVALAVVVLTRDPQDGRTYLEQIRTIAQHPRAARVKVADLLDNLEGRETPPPGLLADRYRKALRILAPAVAAYLLGVYVTFPRTGGPDRRIVKAQASCLVEDVEGAREELARYVEAVEKRGWGSIFDASIRLALDLLSRA